MALRTGRFGLYVDARIGLVAGFTACNLVRPNADAAVRKLTIRNELSTQNWSGQGESDSLVKTKHCDGAKA
jgi:hypothetical protein